MVHICKNPFFHKGQGLLFDCGSCRACRLKRRGEWALRMEHESSTVQHKTLFVTLTYNAEHLPQDYGLSIKDCQKFFKRLRRRLDKKNDETKFKYYLCGEYGPKTRRPHYHAIIMGLDITYANDIYKAWGLCDAAGFKCVQTADIKSFKYVAGYAAKKLGTKYNEKFLEEHGIQPEFQLQSHGIGKKFIMNIEECVKKNCTIRYAGKNRIPPRYYRKLLGLTAENYKDILEEYQNDLNEKAIKLCKSYGWPMTDLMQSLREECDYRLYEREKEWRHKCAATN